MQGVHLVLLWLQQLHWQFAFAVLDVFVAIAVTFPHAAIAAMCAHDAVAAISNVTHTC